MDVKATFQNCVEDCCNGRGLSFEQALSFSLKIDTQSLLLAADRVRKEIYGTFFDLCSIINAKSGRCTEDCKFCAQSIYHNTEVTEYDSIGMEETLLQALDNQNHGVKRFSLVTAGRTVSLKQLEYFRGLYKELCEKTNLKLCSSMGFLTEEKAEMLVDSGVSRYHCNLETSRSFFAEICTTHSWDEKVATIKIAQSAGMDVCSGGIIGMGETEEQRIELACQLRDLNILSIPINILTPIPTTGMESMDILDFNQVLRTISLFRLINPKAIVRLAGGRNQYGESQYDCFCAGANGAIVGNYLTTKGNNLSNDIERIKDKGFDI